MKTRMPAVVGILGACLAFLTFLVYLPSLRNAFVNWDDPMYVLDNVHIRSLDPAFFKWAFGFYAANWHPLTLISLAFDYALWGLDPAGYHCTNAALHAANTFLVFIVIFRLLGFREAEARRKDEHSRGFLLSDQGKIAAAAVTALLFGLHPIHVESVAWISERKDLLCTLFTLMSVLAYCSYAGNRGPGASSSSEKRSYWFSLILFTLALMSKPMAVTLPVVLLILDWHPLGKMESTEGLRTALREKVPFFLLSIASSALTIAAQQSGGALVVLDDTSLTERIITAVNAYGGYLRGLVLPLQLLPYYPYLKTEALFAPLNLAYAAISAGALTLPFLVEKRSRTVRAAAAFYIITLLPVAGFIQVGGQAMADRYAYLASLGPFLLMAAGFASVAEPAFARSGSRSPRPLAYAAGAVVIALLCMLTVKQIGIWKNSITLWNYVIRSIMPEERRYRTSHIAYANRGREYLMQGDLESALRDSTHAIELDPSSYAAYQNRSMIFEQFGRRREALQDINVAIQLQGNNPNAYNDRGILLKKIGRLDEALDDYNRAIRLKPDVPAFYYNRGNAVALAGRYEEAVRDYTAAIELSRVGHPDYFRNRAEILSRLGRADEARGDVEAARSLEVIR